jgi:hypothetical protein
MQTERERIREAYLQMAEKARFRPQAPGDWLGDIQLSEKKLLDATQLAKEADDYADRFIAEENTSNFHIGVSNFATNRALVYTIEAARLLCAVYGESYALKLLEMAAEELRESRKSTPQEQRS